MGGKERKLPFTLFHSSLTGLTFKLIFNILVERENKFNYMCMKYLPSLIQKLIEQNKGIYPWLWPRREAWRIPEKVVD